RLCLQLILSLILLVNPYLVIGQKIKRKRSYKVEFKRPEKLFPLFGMQRKNLKYTFKPQRLAIMADLQIKFSQKKQGGLEMIFLHPSLQPGKRRLKKRRNMG